MDDSANVYRAHDDPVDPGRDDGEGAPDYGDGEENDTFSSYVALDDVYVFAASELECNRSSCRFLGQCSRSRSVRNWYKPVHKPTFLMERRTGKVKVRVKAMARAHFSSVHHVYQSMIDDNN